MRWRGFIKSLWHTLGTFQMLAGFITFILALQPIFQPLVYKGCYFGFSFFPNSHLKINIVNLQCCVSFRCIAKWFSYTYECVCVKGSAGWSVMSNSLWPRGLYSPWNSPGQNTGVVAFIFSRGSSQPRDRTQLSHIASGFFTSWAARGAHMCIIYIYSFSDSFPL